MSQPTILVIRMSAMGDVALTIPLIREAAKQARIVVVTRSLFGKFFENIENVNIIIADTSGIHKGIPGIFRLYKDIIAKYDLDLILDLHYVIRSRILSLFFRMSGKKVLSIEKGRHKKKQFIKTRKGAGLIHTKERYRLVFERAGISISEYRGNAFILRDSEKGIAKKYLSERKFVNKSLIAVAPFARHVTKQWPLSHVKSLVDMLDATGKVHVFLFGGKNESDLLAELCTGESNISVVAGKFSLREELAILTRMDLMICMDSSNLHMASVSGVQTISIWGGTHPEIGFGPTGSQKHTLMQLPLEQIDCRPCTVYGKGGCKLSENKFRCLTEIYPEKVFKEIEKLKLLS